MSKAKNEAIEKTPQPGAMVSTLSEAGKRAQAAHKTSTENIIIPRILLMQATSDKVAAQTARFGELRDTLENKLHGGFDSPLEVIPIHSFETYTQSEKSPSGNVFLGTIPAEGNQGKPYEEVVDGKTIVNMYTINTYVLLPQEIADGMDMPYLLTFRSTSVRCGKKINTIMYMRNLAAGRDPWAAAIMVTANKTKNDQGTFGVFDVAGQRAATEKEMLRAQYWFNVIDSGSTEIAEENTVDAPQSDVPF